MDQPTRRFDDPPPQPPPAYGPPALCAKCGGLITTSGVEGGSQRVNLIQRETGKFLAPKTDLLAYVCTRCGYTEFYAMDVSYLVPDNPNG